MALQLSKSTILIDQTHPGPDFMMQARTCRGMQTFLLIAQQCFQRNFLRYNSLENKPA